MKTTQFGIGDWRLGINHLSAMLSPPHLLNLVSSSLRLLRQSPAARVLVSRRRRKNPRLPGSSALRLSLLLTALLPLAAQAQDPATQVLPDLAPRQVEIQGELEIAFPSLARQPLIGFNPPPAVPEIPRTQAPHVEAYKQQTTNLPPSPLQRPEPPQVAGLVDANPIKAELEALGGRYASRAVRLNVGAPIGAGGTVDLRFHYDGAEGHTPFDAQPNLNNQDNVLDGRLGLEFQGGTLTGGAAFNGFYEAFNLYGVEAPVAIFRDNPNRTGWQAGGGAWLRNDPNQVFSFDAGLDYAATTYESDLFTGNNAPLVRNERRLTVRGQAGYRTGSNTLGATAAFSTASQDNAALGSDVVSLEAGLSWRWQQGRALEIEAGPQALYYDLARDAQGAARSGTYLSPRLRLALHPADGFTAYLQNRPGIDRNSLATLFRENPYLVSEPQVQPTVRTVDAEGGVQVFAGPFQLKAYVGYLYAPNFQFHEHGANVTNGFSEGYTHASYARARVLRVGGAAGLMLGNVHALVGATFRDGQLTETDDPIPYLSPVEGHLALSLAFAGRRGLWQTTGTLASPRYRDRAETEAGKVGAFVDIDTEVSYNITPTLGLLARLANITVGDRERWDRYAISPFVAMGGLRMRF